jgi:hypothetical protein
MTVAIGQCVHFILLYDFEKAHINERKNSLYDRALFFSHLRILELQIIGSVVVTSFRKSYFPDIQCN